MRHKDFVVVIITHQRARNIVTLDTLKNAGYTGPVIFLVDDLDPTLDQYRALYGDAVHVFDKRAEAAKVDIGYQTDALNSITFGRNASFQAAKDRGYRYFVQLDDDYVWLQHRWPEAGKLRGRPIKNIGAVWDVMIDCLAATQAKTICMAQAGDYVGGVKSNIVKKRSYARKAMNSFVCDVERPFQFIGLLNEDVTTYTLQGNRGALFFTAPQVALGQIQSQSQPGGITELYLETGTYLKAFSTFMRMPSAVKIARIATKGKRIHHVISWTHAVPKIVPERYRKA